MEGINFITTSSEALAFHRQAGTSEAIVVINRGPTSVTMDLSGVGTGMFVKLDGSMHALTDPLVVPPSSSDILRKTP